MGSRRIRARTFAVLVGGGVSLALAVSGASSAPGPTVGADADKAANQAARAVQDTALAPDVGRASTLPEEDAARAAASQVQLVQTDSGEQTATQDAAERVSSDTPLVPGSRLTVGALTVLKSELSSKAGKAGVSYGFYYDVDTDSVVVEGNLPEADLPKAARAKGVVTYLPSQQAGRGSRYNDSTPHWGGSAITTTGVRCTSAFTVQTSSGARRSVTAGHCGTVGTRWSSGSYYFGTMTSRGNFPARDLALLSGSTYGSYVYMGARTGTGTPTGTFRNPVIGSYYCTSGSTTFENCGKRVASLSASFCDASGCTRNLVAFRGGTRVAGGDSGGPLVLKGSSKVYPRGVVIAYSGSTMYAEKWSTVARTFGVTGVTSG